MVDIAPLLVALAAFGCIAGLVFVAGRYFAGEAAVRRRLTVGVSASAGGDGDAAHHISGILSSIAARIDERKFGIEGPLRSKLRRELIRAGYFSDAAISVYILFRIAAVIVIPTVVFIIFQTIGAQIYVVLLGSAVGALIGILGPDAYISRRQGALQREYRINFPDSLDMLVVCVDAGLGLDAAIARIWPEVVKRNRHLGTNFAIIGVETRAGRSLTDAIKAFADRLNLDEARAFAILLRQSMELGTDITSALRVFSEEMRTKRLLRAEEMANKLPVKMVLPLGLFIFPVIMMTVLVPTIIKMLAIFHAVH